jgi:hypothetical protein
MQFTLRALPQGALSKFSGGYSSVHRTPDCDYANLIEARYQKRSFIPILRLWNNSKNLVIPWPVAYFILTIHHINNR